jgi:hypothetical protein
MQQRRRSERIPLELPMEFEWRGASHSAVTALVNDDGALVRSPVSCPLKARLPARNPETGVEGLFEVAWTWVESEDADRQNRLGLKMLEPGPVFWGPQYDAAKGRRSQSRQPASTAEH